MKYFIYFLASLSLLFTTCVMADVHPGVSLRDKIGQMLLIGFDGKTVNAKSSIVKIIQKHNIGGVILFDYDYRTKTYDRNIASPTQVKKLNSDLQYFNKQGHEKYHRPPLPLLISVDYEGGAVTRLDKEYGFPPTISAAEVGTKSIQEIESTAQSMAQVLKEYGFNLNFAPVLDVNVNSDNPIIGKVNRSFSHDTNTIITYALIFSRHFLNQKIQCAYKHFPGHGSATQDSHLSFVDVTDTWQPDELEPYRQLLRSKTACGMVMTAHIVNRQLDESGLPATLSYKTLTGMLRKQLHFKGVIITDDMQMKAISEHYTLAKALELAINAGADMIIFGNNLSAKPQDPKQLIDIIEAKVLSGVISLDRINEAYQRIIAFKQSLNPH